MVVMSRGWVQIFCPGQLVSQLGWFVDQDGQMLRTDPNLRITVLHRQQGYLLAVTFTIQTLVFVIGH